MIAAVREGKLIAMEGDYDHIVNRGSLCVKGISMFATHTSPNRLRTPRYRAPRSEEHTSELQSHSDLVCRLLLEKKKKKKKTSTTHQYTKNKHINKMNKETTL